MCAWYKICIFVYGSKFFVFCWIFCLWVCWMQSICYWKLFEWQIFTAIGWCNSKQWLWFWQANRCAYLPFKMFFSSRLIASSILTDEKFNKTLKTCIQSIWVVFEKQTYHNASKFIQTHTGMVYFVVHYVLFVYWCYILWDVCFSVILAAN